MARGFTLGEREIRLLMEFARRQGGGVSYWMLIKALCGEKQRTREYENCRTMTTRALRSLRRKNLIYKKRYKGEVTYYLTRQGRDLLNRLGLGP